MEEKVKQNKVKPFGLLKKKWVKVTALGMGGLLIVVWFVSIITRP